LSSARSAQVGSSIGGVGEPRGEGGGVQVENDVADAVGAEGGEALAEEGLLGGAEPAAQAPLEAVLQRLEDGLLGSFGD